MRILIFNWRDIQNPKGGGAEILTFEIAKRWVAMGHAVTQFSERFNGSKSEVTLDGVRIIRGGSAQILSFRIPVHIAAFFWYLKNKNNFDLVIDEIHGIPFFTPFYVRTKKIALICEVADDIWDMVFSFPVNKLGRFIENNYFRFYKKVLFLTISNSTKNDIEKKGIEKDHISVLPMGITAPSDIKKYPKEKIPTVIFVGRLSPTKGVDDALRAISKLKKRNINCKIWVVGRGEKEFESYIYKLVQELNIKDRVKFFGFVSEKEKFELMSRAHILVAPSKKEGWGLIVSEASLVGTPAVVYNVSGLKDIVKNNVNGIISDINPESLAENIKKLLENNAIYERLRTKAQVQAKNSSWDTTARCALKVIENSKPLLFA